mmetsp:Transcript_4481/g.6858  ORF Transcript_4481/g.6858 Transcript_4481/m.6858 type:complete len:374 (+) Transcript_4481:38-1159(+)
MNIIESTTSNAMITIRFTSASTLRRLIVIAACVLQIRASNAAATSQSSTSYQPTSGVEGKWVAEEEFYGASDLPTHHADPDHKDHFWWDEDEESEMEEGIHQSEYSSNTQQNIAGERKRRRWRRKGNKKQHSTEDPLLPSSRRHDKDVQNNEQPSSEYDEEHPMRTDEWALDIHLSRLFAQEGDELFPECYTDRDGRSNPKLIKKNRYRKRQVMTFATNGYVKVSVTDDDSHNNDRIDTTTSSVRQTLRNKPRIGKWRIGHSGVAFDIPVQMSVSRKNRDNGSKVKEPKMTVLHYHADIHLNKFGERPRMFRGVITRDRHSSFLPPNLFRPVIGTFSAEGIGHDTADTSYKTRAISLSRQQVINDAKSNAKSK